MIMRRLLAILGFSLVGCAAHAQQGARDPYFGLHIHRADTGTAWPAVSFGAWRLWDAGVSWQNLEPQQGRWDFVRLDRYVSFGERFGVDILLPLGLTPTWASARPTEKSSYQPGNAAEPANTEDWRRYVRTVAERYRGRVRNYDIWNEVNEKGFYTGSVEKLVELTCEAHRIIHEISSENRVVSPSFIGAGSEPEQLQNFLRKGGKACVDIIGFHFYVPHREPEEIVALTRRVQAVMLSQGLAKMPLWNTESGWWMENADGTPQPGADQRWRKVSIGEGAAVTARSLILARWAGISRFYWYAWDNQLLGLIEPSTGALKPAGLAYGTLIGWMNKSVPQCNEQDRKWVCSLPDANGEIRRMAWKTDLLPASLTLPTNERLLAIEQLSGVRDNEVSKTRSSVALSVKPVLVISVRQ